RQEMIHQQGNILCAAAQWWQINGNDVQTVIKVFAKASFAHLRLQLDIRGGNDSHVDLDFMYAAQVHELLVLNYAQNLGLGFQAHGADFIEEDCSSVRDLKQALFGRDSAGKSALDVAKEGRFQKIGGHGAAVDRHKGTVFARRISVDGLGDEFLARAAFALDQHRRTAGRDLRNQVENLEHDFAFAHDVFKVVALLEGALELLIFLFHAPAVNSRAYVGQQLFIVPRLLDE